MSLPSIMVLKGPDRVRRRPAVIFGSDGIDGVLTAVTSLLDIFITEAALGFSKGIDVTVHTDHSVSIHSHDRGFLPDETSVDGKPAWVRDFCDLYAEPRHSDDTAPFGFACKHADLYGATGSTPTEYQVNSDRFFDLVCVQYACAFFRVEATRDGTKKTLLFEKGYAVSDMIKEPSSDSTGTLIRLLPDAEVFTDIRIRREEIAAVLRHTAATVPGLICTVRDERDNTAQTFSYPNGIRDLATSLSPSLRSLRYETEIEAVGKDRYNRPEYKAAAKLVLGFCEQDGTVLCLHNYRKLPGGGTHLDALCSKLLRYINFERTDSQREYTFDDIAKHVVIILETNCSPRATEYKNEARTAIQNRMITDMASDLIGDSFQHFLKCFRDDFFAAQT